MPRNTEKIILAEYRNGQLIEIPFAPNFKANCQSNASSKNVETSQSSSKPVEKLYFVRLKTSQGIARILKHRAVLSEKNAIKETIDNDKKDPIKKPKSSEAKVDVDRILELDWETLLRRINYVSPLDESTALPWPVPIRQ